MRKIFLASLAAGFIGTGALAGADDDIKQRQNAMKAIGGATSQIAAVLQGKVEGGDLAKLVALLAAASDTAITVPAFKANTDGKGTAKQTSSPEVWSDWAKFEGGLANLAQVTAAAAAKGGAVSFGDMKPVFASCKGCHNNFRTK